VHDEVKEGDQVLVKVVSIDPSGKIRLSRKALLEEAKGGEGEGGSGGDGHGGPSGPHPHGGHGPSGGHGRDRDRDHRHGRGGHGGPGRRDPGRGPRG